MKVLSVVGFTQSGKTTTIEKIITELKKRRYRVGSLKDIHYEEFAIDIEGTNTDRHKKAGADLVTARGLYETDILYPEHLDVYKILKHYDHDYVILEGVAEGNFPKIVCAKDEDGITKKIDDRTFMVSGRIADIIESYHELPALSAMGDIEKLVDMIEEKTFEILPNFDEKCCGLCGMSCEALAGEIVKGNKTRSDCLLSNNNISLKIDDEDIAMVPFVQDILRNNVLAIVKELDGYKEGSKIEIQIGI
ncbi:molybdopterin-guanine dinucleotide biosynthesis protein B [Acidaminobacter sp. JC074]|uniref:molybdopterin-guanine dinucleotide biosynthesis protein B n=1 Tax=Acidaminobacter sp. JC074 TaxID=2530199 RepID=UPI001F108350|nr:molybdopterin-guanine dinucleotide biosynthesis protein B [Acidaminobacter sp. JC074]MCH4888096.1 molybdopterin-guanine dinucleotide biosynthesis protein B [Acidaminobacter sp. JC074]